MTFTAREAHRWQQGTQEVWWLHGGVELRHGIVSGRADEAIIWVSREGDLSDRRQIATTYLEGHVEFSYSDAGKPIRVTDSSWYGEFATSGMYHVDSPSIVEESAEHSSIYARALARQRMPLESGDVQQAQFSAPRAPSSITAPQPFAPSLGTTITTIPPGTRRIRAYGRNTAAPQAVFTTNPEGTESVGMITGGVNFIVDGLPDLGTVDITTDNLVVWMQGVTESNLSSLSESFQKDDSPLELYMEGNIVFKQGDRTIYADRMYYDVRNRTGVVLNAEMLTPNVSELTDFQFNGMLRLKAEVLQQLDERRFYASNAWLTSSRLGKPGYRLQSGNIYFEDVQSPVVNPITGQPEINPQTQEQLVLHRKLATSRNNFLFLREVPVLYWPTIATDLRKPTYYINSAQYKNDRIFGNQFLTEFDLYQILGWQNPPPGTDWNLSLDYLDERGFGAGTNFQYEGTRLLGFGGDYVGFFDYWGIDEHDTDNLGSDRPAIEPGKLYRYRLLGRHRQRLPYDIQFSGELGWISDRNFLEEYYENEWDQLKDEITGFELKKLWANQSFDLSSNVRLNDFFTETEWLPRGDHFLLGQPLFGEVFTWYAHSQAGFGKMRVTNTPSDPVDRAKFEFLQWEVGPTGGTTFGGERLVTRQEIDLPVQAGGFKIVPYALGELAHWGEDLTREDLQRAYGQLGVRASIPFWTATPAVESGLLNVHGLAHKVVFDSEFAYSDANRDLTELPLYDQLDDNAVEHFRRRFAFNTFGATQPNPAPVPLRFDERFYAVRTGIGSWVTSPVTEVADDLMAVRFGVKNRLQTKRGLPGKRRIIDWIVLDTNVTWFPKDTDQNFDEPIGLLDYDFRWHIGDRFTLLSDGIFDFFDQGQEIATVGAYLNRPPKGALYVGFHSLQGPINSEVLLASYSYRMSPKWVSAVAMSVDVGGNGNIGENVQITRVGESFLVTLGLNVDANRDNVGVSFLIEPRFLPGGSTLGRAGGATVPLAGLYGLE